MKKVYGTVACISFLLLYGVAGGIEQHTMSIKKGTIIMFLLFAVWALFAWLAGVFYTKKEIAQMKQRSSRQKQNNYK